MATTAKSVSLDRASTLLIGSEQLLAAWAKFASGAPDVLPLVHTDVQRVLDMLELTQPHVVVMEQAIAASTTGASLILRLHNERSWRGTEIRLLTSDQASRVLESDPGETHPQDWLNLLARPLPPRPQRQAPRIAATGAEQILVDGNAVTLVDWSVTGAQVHSPAVLKPNTQVRIKLSIDQASVKTTGVVVWSSFEIQPVNRYRVGIVFANRLELPAVSNGRSHSARGTDHSPSTHRGKSKAHRPSHTSGHRQHT